MRVGTKSILFGAHQFLLHPVFVLLAWVQLYGFPFDPRLWIAFVVHDLGYFGKADMDGEDGERHVEFGARIMSAFGERWRNECLYHSRYYAKQAGARPSRLCIADKLAIAITPAWLYLPLVKLSGELDEYMEEARRRSDAMEGKYVSMGVYSPDPAVWYYNVQDYLRRWAWAHRDGGRDTWTPNMKEGKQ